jgi:hypothetical protein
MQPARGDSKPCDQKDCAGVMRYARPSAEGPRREHGDDLRWICSKESGHAGRKPAVPGTRPA